MGKLGRQLLTNSNKMEFEEEEYETSPMHETLSRLYNKCQEKEQKLNFASAHRSKQEIKQILEDEGRRM